MSKKKLTFKMNKPPKGNEVTSKTQPETSLLMSDKDGRDLSSHSDRKISIDPIVQEFMPRPMDLYSSDEVLKEIVKVPLDISINTMNGITVAVATEIKTLELGERKAILETIKKSKEILKHEHHRQQKLKTKINEIIAIRPPPSKCDPKSCYICFNKFWPIPLTKNRCCRCMIMVCRKCLNEYHILGKICSQCALEILYTAQIGSMFEKCKHDADYSDKGLDIFEVERMIVKTSAQEMSSNHSNHSNDRTDAASIKSKSGSTNSGNRFIRSLFGKKMDNSVELSNIASSIHDQEKDDGNKSLASMVLSDMNLDVTDNVNCSNIYGEILIGLYYIYTKHQFKIIIKRCRNLPAALKKENTSNPFVKIVLLPKLGSEPVLRTTIKYSNLNPDFNEQCKFKKITFDALMARTLMVTVIHREWIGKDVFLGQKFIELSTYPFDINNPLWHTLEDSRPPPISPVMGKYYGDIIFSLKYSQDHYPTTVGDYKSKNASSNPQPMSSGCIIVWINKASNLYSSKYNRLPDSYLKCTLLSEEGSKLSKKKTQVIRKNFNPIWNVQFTFANIFMGDLNKLGLEITLWDKRIGFLPDVLIGGILMNKGRDKNSVNLADTEVWQKMIEKPERWIEAKLLLRVDIR